MPSPSERVGGWARGGDFRCLPECWRSEFPRTSAGPLSLAAVRRSRATHGATTTPAMAGVTTVVPPGTTPAAVALLAASASVVVVTANSSTTTRLSPPLPPPSRERSWALSARSCAS